MTITQIRGRLVSIEIPPVGATRITMEVNSDKVHLIKDLVVGANIEMEQVKPL
jgi:hypothetical protein